MFTVTADKLEYTPAAPGLGEAPTYLVTGRNERGECIELFYDSKHFPKRDQVGQMPVTGAWKLTVYDARNEEVDGGFYFKNFADADAHAHGILGDVVELTNAELDKLAKQAQAELDADMEWFESPEYAAMVREQNKKR